MIYLEDWISNSKELELSCRCLFFLLKIHYNQISTSKSILPTLISLKEITRKNLQKQRDLIGKKKNKNKINIKIVIIFFNFFIIY